MVRTQVPGAKTEAKMVDRDKDEEPGSWNGNRQERL